MFQNPFEDNEAIIKVIESEVFANIARTDVRDQEVVWAVMTAINMDPVQDAVNDDRVVGKL